MEPRGRNKIIVILGPTSSGKSEVAIRLARKYDGEIISADSRQIYRGMDVGTGKISKAQQKLAKHWLIDIIDPKTEYNVFKFKKEANCVINYLHKKNKIPIICGGTGFWIKAIVDDVDFPEVKPNLELRKRLEKENTEKLFKMLQKLDPERVNNIDAKNKVRLIRAIEICKAIGKVPPLPPTPSPSGRGWGEGNIKYDFIQIGIDIPKEKLHQNIKKRLEKRFKQGMIEEVKKLRKSGLSWKKIQSFGLGYFWIPLFLQGKIDKKELFEKVYQAEKDYAKRQMTWFKKDKRIVWLKNYKEIEKEIKKNIL
ncbi:MAG: tRNA (adenosine(37)-N6)-dimethylallyltransferase MiaA [Parcubacteria group bacterium]|jgi:tRNA dimethylallyltransferase